MRPWTSTPSVSNLARTNTLALRQWDFHCLCQLRLKKDLLTGIQAAALAFKHFNITLASDAIDTLQSHGLWVPSAAGLNGVEPMFGDSYNATLENEKFDASGLDINDLVHLGVIDDNSKKVSSMDIAGNETGIANVDVCNP